MSPSSPTPVPAGLPDSPPAPPAPPALPAPPSDTQMAQLVSAARAARAMAYAPYSHFSVGAALLDEHGRVHVGCNVENAAYPQGQCAEASAIGQLVLAGGRRILAAVVVGVADDPVTPCGGCRQRLREFAADDAPIWAADLHGVRARFTLGVLLPASFGPGHLAASSGPAAPPATPTRNAHPQRPP